MPSTSSATAVSRCIHQCSAALLAVPRPRTRLSGVTRLTAAPLQNREPREPGGRDDCDDDHRPAARADRLGIEARTDVPREVANAVREMQKEAEGPADEQYLERAGGEHLPHGFVALRPARDRDQPDRERERARRQQ